MQNHQISRGFTFQGFTLIEMMVTVAIAAIIVGLGVPAMKGFLDTNRRAAAVNSFVTDIQRARSTSASRGNTIVMCTATDASGCSGDTRWEDGWMVFIDSNGNDTFDSAVDTSLSFTEPASGVTMPSNSPTGLLRFSPGFLSMTGNLTVAVCIDNVNENGRQVTVSNTGRPRLVEMTPTTGTPNCL